MKVLQMTDLSPIGVLNELEFAVYFRTESNISCF